MMNIIAEVNTMNNTIFSEQEKKQAITKGIHPEDIELAEKTIQDMRAKAAIRLAYADNIAKDINELNYSTEEISCGV